MGYKQGITTLWILIIASAMVSSYYPGETIVVQNEMGINNLVYTIVGNSSILSPLNISINSTNITIIFPQDMIPDNFDIVFIEKQTNTIVQTIYTGGGGGGSSRTKYIDRNVTVYVPEYVDVPKEVEVIVDKIVDNDVIVETGYELWQILVAGIFGLGLAWMVFKAKKNKVDTEAERIDDPLLNTNYRGTR